MQTNGKTVILANGTFPSNERALAVLRNAERIVACDGAAIPLMAGGIMPDAVIGDLDSISGDLRQRLADRIVHVSEQDTNDLSKAFRFCISNGWRDIVILGATGKREDHTLGNISLLADFSEIAPGISMITDEGEFLALHGPAAVKCAVGQQVSIFALDADTHIYSTNLKYPLEGLAPTRWWQATLNEAVADEFTLDFPAGRAVLVFLAYMR
ncbi:MAG: thiamine diphosphokinase [Victivallales bacterium]|nr:thiamine diphosphokinase [Victivallales bacterium]